MFGRFFALTLLLLVLPSPIRGEDLTDGDQPEGVRRLVAKLRAPETFSVHDAVRAVLERNPDLRAARSRIDLARAGLDRARVAFRPQLAMDLGWMRADAPSAYLFKTIDARAFQSGTNFNDPGVFDNTELGLGLRHTLYDGGRRQLVRRMASRKVAASESEERSVANALIGTVIQAYFDVLASRESVKVAEASEKTVDAQLHDAKTRHRLGGALRSDVLSLEVRKAQARENVIAAGNAVHLAEAAFRRLLDLPLGRAFALSGEEWTPRDLPMSFEEGLLLAKKTRDEFAALDAGLAAAEDGWKLARRADRPRVDLVARSWADDEDADFRKGNWTVGATLSWPLHDGGNRRAETGRARAALAEMVARRRSLERRVDFEVRQAWSNLESARARFAVATSNVSRAEEVLELVRKQFRGGEATVTRYLEVETDRTEARFREVAARYAVKKAKAAWGHALGVCLSCVREKNKEEER